MARAQKKRANLKQTKEAVAAVKPKKNRWATCLMLLLGLASAYLFFTVNKKEYLAKCLRIFPWSSEMIGPPKGLVSLSEAAQLAGQSVRFVHHAFWEHNKPCPSAPSGFGILDYQIAPSAVAVIPEGRVWGPDGIVITAADQAVAETVIKYDRPKHRHELFRQIRLPRAEMVPERLAVVAGKAPYCYYHWLFEILPRLAILQASGIQYDKICLNAIERPFQEETIKTLGLDRDKIIWARPGLHCKAKELIVPTYAAQNGHVADWTIDFVRKSFLPEGNYKPTKRLYITRKHATRRVLNDAEVVALLTRYGFEEVATEHLSVADQARLFASAEFVVAPHGAGLSNLVFCQPKGAKVIEILIPPYSSNCYWLLSNRMHLDYDCLIAASEQELNGTVDCVVLEAKLERMGLKPVGK